MSDSPAPKSSRRSRRKPPALPASRSAATALERTEAEKDAKLEAAIQELLVTWTLDEIDYAFGVPGTARGPQYKKHPKKEDRLLFKGTAEEHRAGLIEATGSRDFILAERLLSEVASTQRAEEPEVDRINRVGPLLAALAPRTPLEGVLTAQMAAVHGLAMHFLSLAAGADRPETIGATAGAANRLLRTFTLQVEALSRLRSPGVTEQRVVVQHVTVADGGQAVIGAVSRTSGGEGG